MTTFKIPWLLALALFSASSLSSSTKPWDTLLLTHQSSLDSAGYFVSSDNHYYYLGFLFSKHDSLEAEFEFLLAFQDRMSSLLGELCKESQSTLSDSYQFNFSFKKDVVHQTQGTVFITSVGKQVLRQEAKLACIK